MLSCVVMLDNSCANQFHFESNYSSLNCSSNITEYFTIDDDEIKSKLNILYAVVESLVAIFAVIGNGLVIVVFCCERKIRRRTNFYIISLATADFLLGLLGIPFAILVRAKKCCENKITSVYYFGLLCSVVLFK